MFKPSGSAVPPLSCIDAATLAIAILRLQRHEAECHADTQSPNLEVSTEPETNVHATHNRFMRLIGSEVDVRGGTRSVGQLPVERDSERFTIVASRDGTIALHSKSHSRFLRMMGDSVDARGGVRDVDSLPNVWDSERFVVSDLSQELPAALLSSVVVVNGERGRTLLGPYLVTN